MKVRKLIYVWALGSVKMWNSEGVKHKVLGCFATAVLTFAVYESAVRKILQ